MKYKAVEYVSNLMDADFRQLMDHWVQRLHARIRRKKDE
jgi:hypothetical protein